MYGRLSCDFNAVKTGQISAIEGEKVEIIEIRDGYAIIRKKNDEEGQIPSYFLECLEEDEEDDQGTTSHDEINPDKFDKIDGGIEFDDDYDNDDEDTSYRDDEADNDKDFQLKDEYVLQNTGIHDNYDDELAKE